MDTSNEYDNLDTMILRTIPRIREEHDACTARSVATLLGASPDVVKYRCQKLRDDGLLTWTDMPGSLRLVDAPPPPAADESVSLPVTDVSPDAAAAQVSAPAPPTAKPRATKKAAAKKPARKRAAPSRAAKPAPQSA